MIFKYDKLNEIIKLKVRGGEGEVRARDYLGPDSAGLPFASLGFNQMQPGATIPEHRHEREAEFYFVVSGKGMGILNGERFPVGPGDGWLCRKGSSHGILNDVYPGQVLSFVTIFFAECP